MTLWPNASLIRAYAQRGKVHLFADSESDQTWWTRWLSTNNIDPTNISYYLIPTNSIWIWDYGPWFILSGRGEFGLIDVEYNRPRALDDDVPELISKELGIPIYQPGLIHTGGNFYSDGVGNAFSSTLVYSENPSLPPSDVKRRMMDFLGIEKYTTSRLNPGITIEHLDTYGKLVAPDTWVIGEFPVSSRYRTDSEMLVEEIRALKSPYGTAYRIFLMKMIPDRRGRYRAYINSFMSNHTLYYATYGEPEDAGDRHAKEVYQAALPGYGIVGVNLQGTFWGDSIHCRSRNLLNRDTIFIFPKVLGVSSRGEVEIMANIYPSPEAQSRGILRSIGVRMELQGVSWR